MNAIPKWHLVGDWFDICSCSIPCPCEFAQAPTNNACAGMLAWHITKGRYGDVKLDGLNLIALGTFEGNIWAGGTKATMGLYMDERADAKQREALQMVFSGQAGGWPATFAANIGEIKGIEFVPIRFEVADDLATWKAEIPGRVAGHAEALDRADDPARQARSNVQPARLGGWARPSLHLGPFDGDASARISAGTGPAKAGPASIFLSIGPGPSDGVMRRVPNPTQREIEHFVRFQPASGLRRASIGLLLSLITLTAAAWVLTFLYAREMSEPMGVAVRSESMAGMAMAGMTAAGWSFAGALTFVILWTVMMAAMMLPSAAPMITIFAAKQARAGRGTAIPTWIFVAGYILVWAAVGVLVYVLVQAASDAATGLLPAERARWAPLALGATLLAAGLYQFTPLKRICLRHCRSPFGFVLRHWREGKWGAFRMGLQHGGYCVGCCWALFAVLTAAGVMSLAWMLVLTLLIFIEKVLPQSRISTMGIGFMFVSLGVAVGTGLIPMPWAG